MVSTSALLGGHYLILDWVISEGTDSDCGTSHIMRHITYTENPFFAYLKKLPHRA